MISDQITKDHVLTLPIEEGFQIVAVGFGPSKLCKEKGGRTDDNNTFDISQMRIT